SPGGRYRSSPKYTSTADQSIPPGARRTASSTAMPVPPPVSTTAAWPRSRCAATTDSTNAAAAARASSSPDSKRRTWTFPEMCRASDLFHLRQGRQGRVVHLVGIEPPQFLGEAFLGVAACERDQRIGFAGAPQRGHAPVLRPL